MTEIRVGQSFVRHEFDGSVAILEAVVAAESVLAKCHPVPEARAVIASCLNEDRAFLVELRRLGRMYGATGEVDDVAESVIDVLQSTVQMAAGADSEAYEAHATTLHAKRKLHDTAGAILAIARALQDGTLREASQRFATAQQEGGRLLAESLARFAVRIAMHSDGSIGD